jgi:putative ABC transport system substrate-binding protein
MLSPELGGHMRRREFITLLGGAAATWPLGAHAQQPASAHRIAVVHPALSPEDMSERGNSPFHRAFFAELRRLGHVEGKNFVVERRSGDGRPERYAEVARDLVNLKPDVIVVSGARMLAYFRDVTTTIPIVAITGDPILFGIVSSLSRPEGNITGFSADASIEIHGKYLEFLKEIKPGLSKVGLLAPRLAWEPYGGPLREIANRMGLIILGPPLDNPVGEPEYRRVVETMVEEGVDALLVTAAAENFSYRRFIIELAEKNRLAAIYPFAEYVKLGGLIAYAVDLGDLGTRAAGYVHNILQGVKPGELPYYMPTKLQLIINLKTAKALGLTVPPTLLASADEVIE